MTETKFSLSGDIKKPDWLTVMDFECRIAAFFGAPYAVAVDSCTHGLELCLRYTKADFIRCPRRTYLSVAMLANKLNIKLNWWDADWNYQYNIGNNIIDAATAWGKNEYMPGHLMCLSFQYQKHLSIGRAGMILTDNKEAAEMLKRMSYDGRLPGIPWRDQNVEVMGYHYYLQPELAQIGINKLPDAINTPPEFWDASFYPDISKFKVFNK